MKKNTLFSQLDKSIAVRLGKRLFCFFNTLLLTVKTCVVSPLSHKCRSSPGIPLQNSHCHEPEPHTFTYIKKLKVYINTRCSIFETYLKL